MVGKVAAEVEAMEEVGAVEVKEEEAKEVEVKEEEAKEVEGKEAEEAREEEMAVELVQAEEEEVKAEGKVEGKVEEKEEVGDLVAVEAMEEVGDLVGMEAMEEVGDLVGVEAMEEVGDLVEAMLRSTSRRSGSQHCTMMSLIRCTPSCTSAGTSTHSRVSLCSRPRRRSSELQTRRMDSRSTSRRSVFRRCRMMSLIPCTPSCTSAGTSTRLRVSWCSRRRRRSSERWTRRTGRKPICSTNVPSHCSPHYL